MTDPVQPDSDREALIESIYDAWNHEEGDAIPFLNAEAREKLAGAILAAGFTLHPQREAPGDEWDYGLIASGDTEPWSDITDDPTYFDGMVPLGSEEDRLHRRRPAGPWLPVDDKTDLFAKPEPQTV